MHKESVHRKDLGLVVFHQLRISIITISTDQICIESVYVKEYSSNPAFALTCHFLVLSLQLDRRYTPRWCILVHACIFYRRTRDSLSKEDTKQVNVLLCRVFVLTGPWLPINAHNFIYKLPMISLLASYAASICLSSLSNVYTPCWKRKHDSHSICRPIATCYACMCVVRQHICSFWLMMADEKEYYLFQSCLRNEIFALPAYKTPTMILT